MLAEQLQSTAIALFQVKISYKSQSCKIFPRTIDSVLSVIVLRGSPKKYPSHHTMLIVNFNSINS